MKWNSGYMQHYTLERDNRELQLTDYKKFAKINYTLERDNRELQQTLTKHLSI